MTNLPPDAPPPSEPDDQESRPPCSEAEWQSLVDYLCGEGAADTRIIVERRLANDPAFAAFAAPLIQAWQAPIPQPAWDWKTNWAVIQRKAAATHGSFDGFLHDPSSFTALRAKQPTGPSSTQSQRRGITTWARGFMQSPVRWRSMQWATLVCAIVAMLITKDVTRAFLRPRYHYDGGLAGATVRLPDSSIAILAPGSYIGTERGFPKISRTVYLFGDARFIVMHNSRIPFIVQVPGASARVLGTTFRMQVDTSPHVRVDVTRGSVAIETCDSTGHWHQVNVLTAGQAVHVPMLAIWIAQAGYTISGTGMPITEATHIEAALRRAAIRLGAAAAAGHIEKEDSTSR